MAKKQQKTEQEQLEELQNQSYNTSFTIKKKNEDGNTVEYKLFYNYDELDVDRVSSALSCYFAFEDVLLKPIQKVSDLDHVNKQQYLKRFYASVLFERNEDGEPKEFNPFVTENKAFDLVGGLRGKEVHEQLDYIKIDFFLNRKEIPKGLAGKVQSLTSVMMQDKRVREQLADEVLNQLQPSKNGKLSTKGRKSLLNLLERFSENEQQTQ